MTKMQNSESSEKGGNLSENCVPNRDVAETTVRAERKVGAQSSHFTKILIGTSGWMYKDWGEKFYPQEMKNPEKLSYISHHYRTLEINTSFYHFVRKSTFEKWCHESAPGFVFSVKVPRFYSHVKRMIVDEKITASMALFFESLGGLGEKLGALLIQLPASLKENQERLDTFLRTCRDFSDQMTHKPDLAVEFRHESWFTESIYETLQRHNTALVIANSSRYPYVVRTTADFSYMRFHGPEHMFLGKYSDKELIKWRDEILRFSPSLRKVYIYFNNDLEANAVENADTLVSLFPESLTQ